MVKHGAIHTIYTLKILHSFVLKKKNHICDHIKHWIKMVLVKTNELFKPQNLINFVLAKMTKQLVELLRLTCLIFKNIWFNFVKTITIISSFKLSMGHCSALDPWLETFFKKHLLYYGWVQNIITLDSSF